MAVEFPRGAALMLRVYFIKAIRQIDERYGQFGSDADLAAEIRRASRKILLVPPARVRHEGRSQLFGAWSVPISCRAVPSSSANTRASAPACRRGLRPCWARWSAFRLGELKYTISGQKIDGTQE